jgi:tubulin---tyrosine ligase
MIKHRINKRKFDFRCYILITTVNGSLKGYWYNDGYIRTSSEEYSLDDMSNRMIHLTNEAVQEKNSTYGKFEDYNKVDFLGDMFLDEL